MNVNINLKKSAIFSTTLMINTHIKHKIKQCNFSSIIHQSVRHNTKVPNPLEIHALMKKCKLKVNVYLNQIVSTNLLKAMVFIGWLYYSCICAH